MSDTPRKYAQCTREEWFERWEAWTANDYIAEEEQMAMRDCFAHIEELERENADLRAQLEAARKDAGRYRWLRDNIGYTFDETTATAFLLMPRKQELTAYIDAAIAQAKGEK